MSFLAQESVQSTAVCDPQYKVYDYLRTPKDRPKAVFSVSRGTNRPLEGRYILRGLWGAQVRGKTNDY